MINLKDQLKENFKNFKLIEFIRIYLEEFMEALIAVTVVRFLLSKGINFKETIIQSMIIGFVTFILENFSPDTKKSVKNGINLSIGTTLMKTITE